MLSVNFKEYLGVIASGTPIHGKLLQSSGIDQGNESARWADYSGSDKLNVVCTKIAGQGKN